MVARIGNYVWSDLRIVPGLLQTHHLNLCIPAEARLPLQLAGFPNSGSHRLTRAFELA
jgi:hypothetical protein